MGGALVARDTRFTFHRSPVLEICHSRRWIEQMVGDLDNNGYPSITPWYCVSAEFVGAVFLVPGICTRWAALYALPLTIGAAQFWAVRKGFYFTGAGSELPVAWSAMLVVQILLGDGPYAVVSSVSGRTTALRASL